MRHPEGGFVVEEIRGVKRMTDFYGRQSLILFFKSDSWTDVEPEPVCVLLYNPGAPGGPYEDAETWIEQAMMEGADGEWGDCSDEQEVDERKPEPTMERRPN